MDIYMKTGLNTQWIQRQLPTSTAPTGSTATNVSSIASLPPIPKKVSEHYFYQFLFTTCF